MPVRSVGPFFFLKIESVFERAAAASAAANANKSCNKSLFVCATLFGGRKKKSEGDNLDNDTDTLTHLTSVETVGLKI